METKFQTSFIPKKPLVTDQKIHASASVSIFMTLAVILFVVSLAGAGFVIAWQKVLLNSQNTLKTDLAANQQRFDTTKIQELQTESVKIDTAQKLLNSHLSVSEIFNIIGGLTIDGVKFSNLEYTGPQAADPTNPASGMATIDMKGLANSFLSIAWQSDVFGSSSKYGTNKILKNPVLSDLAVDEDGNVGFSFTANIDPADLSYEKILNQELQAEGAIPSPASSTPGQTTNQ